MKQYVAGWRSMLHDGHGVCVGRESFRICCGLRFRCKRFRRFRSTARAFKKVATAIEHLQAAGTCGTFQLDANGAEASAVVVVGWGVGEGVVVGAGGEGLSESAGEIVVVIEGLPASVFGEIIHGLVQSVRFVSRGADVLNLVAGIIGNGGIAHIRGAKCGTCFQTVGIDGIHRDTRVGPAGRSSL